MVKTMKKYTRDGKKVVVVMDLSFLYDRGTYSWIGREIRHFRLKRALKEADLVIAENSKAASGLHKYYRVDADAVIPERQDGSQGPSQA